MPTAQFKTEAEWLTLRDQNIGGSEVAALFARWRLPDGSEVTRHAYSHVDEAAIYLGSCSPYTNAYALWLAKTGRVMPEDWNPSERMQAGTYLEPAIADWARNKFGMRLRKVRRYHLHDEIAGWGASVDYEEHGPGMPPVEIKNIDRLVANEKWVIDGDEVIAAPLHITLQLQHYLGARNASHGYIIACIGGNELARGRFDRHEPTQRLIAEAVTAFWKGVAEDRPPAGAATMEAVKDEFAYGDRGATADLTGQADAARLARSLDRWQRHLKFTQTHIDSIKGRLALKVGEATTALGDGFRVSWPVIERKEKVIPERVQPAKTYRGAFKVTLTNEKEDV